MAKSKRGAGRAAMGGRRAPDKGGGKGKGNPRPGRPSDQRYTLRGAAARAAEDVPCPARGRHGEDCICGGTGTVKGTR